MSRMHEVTRNEDGHTQMVEAVDLRSLGRIALVFSAAASLAVAFGVLLAFLIGSLVGVIGQFEEFMRSIGFRDFQVVGPELIAGGFLIGASFVVLVTVVTILGGAVYNVAAAGGRGVRVRIGTAPAPAASRAALPQLGTAAKSRPTPAVASVSVELPTVG